MIEHLPPLIHHDADPWLTGPMPDPDGDLWSNATRDPCDPVPADPINPERRGGAA